jgi:hypothetical protein
VLLIVELSSGAGIEERSGQQIAQWARGGILEES